MDDRCRMGSGLFYLWQWGKGWFISRNEHEQLKKRELHQFDSKSHRKGENAENFFETEQWFDKHFRRVFL